MMEIADYRAGERAARSVIPNWRIAEAHQVDVFARFGFPVRIESNHEVGQLLDTMQEQRFDWFMTELGGLSKADHTILCDALTACVKFQIAHLPKRRPILPLSTMMSVLAIYKKIAGFKPDIGSVLEVGPGCGYLSFILASQGSLIDYSQAEACESFYVLQSMINSYLFGHEFCEFAIGTSYDLSLNIRSDIDPSLALADSEIPPYRCFHFPWWTLRALHDGAKRYDVVTSNANLNELSRNALRDYLTIFSHALKDDGIFLIQCTGFSGHGTLEDLFGVLFASGYAPLFCGLAEDIPPLREKTAFFDELGLGDKRFPLNNLVLVKKGHPMFEECYQRENYSHGYAATFDKLRAMYRYDDERRAYTKEELFETVKANLQRG